MRFDHIVKDLEYGIDHINKAVSRDDTVKNVLIDQIKEMQKSNPRAGVVLESVTGSKFPQDLFDEDLAYVKELYSTMDDVLNDLQP